MEPVEASQVPQLLPRRGPEAALRGPQEGGEEEGRGHCQRLWTLSSPGALFPVRLSRPLRAEGSLGSVNTLVMCSSLFQCQNFRLNSFFFFSGTEALYVAQVKEIHIYSAPAGTSPTLCISFILRPACGFCGVAPFHCWGGGTLRLREVSLSPASEWQSRNFSWTCPRVSALRRVSGTSCVPGFLPV